MTIEKALKELGLKNNAIQVYVACLEIGSGSILSISKRAQLPRSTCDILLTQLFERGFVTTFRKKRTRYFSAEDPRKILSLLKEKTQTIEAVLPRLLSLYGHASPPATLRSYKGTEGIKTILREILDDNPRELLNFSWADDVFKILPDIFPSFVERRIKQKIPVKVITYDTEFSRKRQQRGGQDLREMRLMPKGQEFHAMLSVWNRKIALFSLEKDQAVFVIESKELSRMQRTIFFSLWNTLPSPNHN